MTSTAIEEVVSTFNQQFHLIEGVTPCFSGTLKGVRADCGDLSRHLLDPRTPVTARVDDWSRTEPLTDCDVIIAVGINYGQSAVASGIYDETRMRPHLDGAFELLKKHLRPGCIRSELPLPKSYHLVAYNFFPWLTSAPWSELGINAIEEALLVYCLGYSGVFKPLDELLKKIKSAGGKIKWVVFHGANNAVAALGTAFCQTLHPVNRPEILFCDNLAWKVASNSVALCSPPL